MLSFDVSKGADDLVSDLSTSELRELYDALDQGDLCSYFDLIPRDDAGEHCTREHADE